MNRLPTLTSMTFQADFELGNLTFDNNSVTFSYIRDLRLDTNRASSHLKCLSSSIKIVDFDLYSFSLEKLEWVGFAPPPNIPNVFWHYRSFQPVNLPSEQFFDEFRFSVVNQISNVNLNSIVDFLKSAPYLVECYFLSNKIYASNEIVLSNRDCSPFVRFCRLEVLFIRVLGV